MKVEIIDDGFSKTRFMCSSKPYVNPNDDHIWNKNAIAISGKDLIFLSNSMSNSGTYYIDIKLIVNGLEKSFWTYARPSFIQSEIHGIKDCLFLSGYMKGEFLDNFLNASEILIKADGKSSTFGIAYFKMKLNPTQTQKTWNEYTNGEYFKERDRIANEKLAREKEQERIKEEEEKQDLETLSSIEAFLKAKDTKSAYEEYEKLNKSSSVVLDKIQNMVKSNNAEIGRLLSEKKIEQALDLYLITGRDDELLNKIKSALAEKYPEPQTPLDNSKLVSLLSSNALTEIRSMAFKLDLKIYLTIQKDGQAILKNGTSVLKQFKAEEKYISSNTYKDILYKVDANYPITLDVDSLNYSIYGLEFSKDFLQFKSDIDSKKISYYSANKGEQNLILSKVSDGNDISKKYLNVQRISTFEFSDDYNGKKARLIYTCALKLNGQAFSAVYFKDKNFITTFKKFK